MRVLLCTNSLDRGSTSRTLEAWARLLPAHGIHPMVSVGGPGPLYSALLDAGVPTSIRQLRVTPGRTWAVRFVGAAGALGGRAWSSGAAVLHVNEHDNHPIAALAARLARVPVVTHVRFRPTREYAAWLFRTGRVPARLFFTSRTQLDDSAEAIRPVVPEERWRVLPNGLDFSVYGADRSTRSGLRASWGIDDDAILLGTACAISRRKRIDHFIRLVARLRAAGIPAYGFVAGATYLPGDQEVLGELLRSTVDLGVQDAVRFLGYVEPSEPLYHAWDICVGTSSYETFGMTMLEAMGCSCPIVSYPSGSVAEIVGKAAHIVPDGDEDGLFSVCLTLARDAALRHKLGDAGRQHAMSNYDIRRIVPMLAREYRDLAAVPDR